MKIPPERYKVRLPNTKMNGSEVMPAILESALALDDIKNNGSELSSYFMVKKITKHYFVTVKLGDRCKLLYSEDNNYVYIIYDGNLIFNSADVQLPHPYEELGNVFAVHNNYIYLELHKFSDYAKSSFIFNISTGQFTPIPYQIFYARHDNDVFRDNFLAINLDEKKYIAHFDDIANGIYDNLLQIDYEYILYCDNVFIIQLEIIEVSTTPCSSDCNVTYKIYSSEEFKLLYSHKINGIINFTVPRGSTDRERKNILAEMVKDTLNYDILVVNHTIFFNSVDTIINFGKKEVDNDCCVCLEKMEKPVQFIPCTHVVCCEDCSKKIMSSENSQCPICRENIKQII